MPTYTLKKSGLSINLTERDFIAEGGEGKVYAKNGVAYKIGSPIPDGKLNELSLIGTEYILAPFELMLTKNKVVGYSMPLAPLDDCWQLPLLFTNTFWQRENVTTDQILNLVLFLRKQFQFIHERACLIVDANPFNFLAHKSLKSAYLIDVNSYMTKSYPATAIMPSVQDHHTKGFTENSDWFSFALLTFELLTGLHAFRGGSHPEVSGDKDQQMLTRMQRNLSVLNPKSRFPKNACRPFSSIPQNWLSWYTSEFEQGKRSAPPLSITSVEKVAKVATTRDSVKLNIKEIFSSDEREDILRFEYVCGKQVVITKKYVYVDNFRITNSLSTKNLIFNGRVLHSIADRVFNVQTQQQTLDLDLSTGTPFIYGEAAYVKTGQYIKTLELVDFAPAMFFSKIAAQVMPNSTFIGNNFLAHNAGGSNFLVVLKENASYQIRIKELDGAQIFEGHGFDKNQILWARKYGKVFKATIHLEDDYQGYQIDLDHIDHYDLQAVQLDNGILVQTTPDGNLELSKGNSRRIIEDRFLSDEPFILGACGAKVIIARHGSLMEVSLK